jgi:hypothetical protein
MIDVTKPLELADGRPVTFINEDTRDGTVLVKWPDGETWWHSKHTGAYIGYDSEPSIRNVAPAFDPTKPVETRDGRKSCIICSDAKNKHYPIVALVTDAEGEETVQSHTVSGGFYRGTSEDCDDLVNVEPETVEYVNLGQSFNILAPAQRVHDDWPVLKVTRRGDKLVSSELLPAAAA